jgi:hypothetical protein
MRPICLHVVVAALAAVLTGCGTQAPAPAVDAGWSAALEQMKSTIASSTGYSSASIEVLASPAHLRIAISDAKLAQADQAARESAATAVMAAAEQVMAKEARLATVQEMSVAIIHPAGADLGTLGASHTEDVVDFRRGPSQRFSKHIT